MMYYMYAESIVGDLILYANETELTALNQAARIKVPADFERADKLDVLKTTKRQLAEYFAGERKDFDVPLFLEGTEFQKRAWRELIRIEYGTTISYRQQAERVGNPKACRAVGMANSRNPIAIIVPCHRVIGENGTLTGYAGGLPMKQTLLELERNVYAQKLPLLCADARA